ncbi:MAG: Txe/YoeB family addiction module toxin [Prevotellaceae bacterium]|jgi:toxin YoeB|nr:Txe/YoeB family addiction module toxin [Prevotellaceae bacterium]
MEFLFKDEAEKDLDYWNKTNKSVIKKIELLLKSMQENPFAGIGHPEPLKENLSGYWSRRINQEHRIVYTVQDETITIYSLKGHY